MYLNLYGYTYLPGLGTNTIDMKLETRFMTEWTLSMTEYDIFLLKMCWKLIRGILWF